MAVLEKNTPSAASDIVENHAVSPGTSRRDFIRALGAGILIAVAAEPGAAQVAPRGLGRSGRGGQRRGGFGRGGPSTIAARLHIGLDGIITVMTGKVECGQGARAEHTQAAAEELGVAADQVRLIMADTELVPDDGGTFGSQSTPSSVPSIRRGCAAARNVLCAFAGQRWNVDPKTLNVRGGKVKDAGGKQTLGYADLAADKDAAKLLAGPIPGDVALSAVQSWKVMGTSVPRPNQRDLVTGAHQYPSDIHRPGMLYGKVLRPPAYGATLESLDTSAARAMPGVIVVQDKDFVGVAAPTSFRAAQAIEALANSAKWNPAPAQPSSEKLYDHLREHARGGIPKNPYADEAKGGKTLAQTYHVAYVQHCPLEPRAAVAEWEGPKLMVWTGTQNPFRVKSELVSAMGVPENQVRVIVPDFGGAFGGKHTGECAVEAARLARAIGKPVSLRWTREEEFTWAYFRPAALIEAAASIDDSGTLTSWSFINVNSGGNEVQTPYRVAKNQCKFVGSDAPLKHGSYRALAVTANNFGRESFMDEMAHLAARDPLEFRLAHLDEARLRNVLQEAANKFNWAKRASKREPNVGVGLACGTDKGSVVAACVEVKLDDDKKGYKVTHVCQAFECGKIVNPENLNRQVGGAIVMGMGPALREEMRFADGKILNASFRVYQVPRFGDVPELDIHLIDRPDLPSAGAGETPIIAIAPAIANALFAACGIRVRQMPIRLPAEGSAPTALLSPLNR
jgi:isoquinoline 1-oxidoreductase subunit beta